MFKEILVLIAVDFFQRLFVDRWLQMNFLKDNDNCDEKVKNKREE
jgi:hypothetical protein